MTEWTAEEPKKMKDEQEVKPRGEQHDNPRPAHEHSPLPWKWKHTALWSTSPPEIGMEDALRTDEPVLYAVFASRLDVNTANAQFLLCAVNSHADLVAARDAAKQLMEFCEAVIFRMDMATTLRSKTFIDLVTALDAALAKAKEKNNDK